jgi:hypothetical protein
VVLLLRLVGLGLGLSLGLGLGWFVLDVVGCFEEAVVLSSCVQRVCEESLLCCMLGIALLV